MIVRLQRKAPRIARSMWRLVLGEAGLSAGNGTERLVL